MVDICISSCLYNCGLIVELVGVMDGSNVGSVHEQGNFSDGMPSLSPQTATVMSSLPHAWFSDHKAAVQSCGLSTDGQRQLTASSRPIHAVRPVSSVMTRQQSVIPSSYHPETPFVPALSRSQSLAALSTGSSTCGVTRRTSGQHSSMAGRVELKHAATLAVESSRAGVIRLRSSSALEMGNVHLRDLLSQDDDDAAAGDSDELNVKSSTACQSHESPQEPQSTSCDDPPDSSTGSVRSSVSILKQLLADSDSEDQNEVSTCQPETTHAGTESHILLKVCCNPAFMLCK